jgi:hypothetical protein
MQSLDSPGRALRQLQIMVGTVCPDLEQLPLSALRPRNLLVWCSDGKAAAPTVAACLLAKLHRGVDANTIMEALKVLRTGASWGPQFLKELQNIALLP